MALQQVLLALFFHIYATHDSAIPVHLPLILKVTDGSFLGVTQPANT